MRMRPRGLGHFGSSRADLIWFMEPDPEPEPEAPQPLIPVQRIGQCRCCGQRVLEIRAGSRLRIWHFWKGCWQ